MIPQPLDYTAPATVAEALAVLAARPDARLLAGGQGVLAGLQTGDETASVLVDLRRVRGLRGIRTTVTGDLRLGAMTTLDEVATDPMVRTMVPALAEAAGAVGDPQIRNRATIGGNLAAAASGTDLPAVALALAAGVRVATRTGDRDLSFAEYLERRAAGDAGPDTAVLTAVVVPGRQPDARSAFEKLAHRANSLPVSAVAVELVMGEVVAAARIARSGPVRSPERLPEVEAALVGTDGGREAVRAAVAALPDTGFAGVPGYSAEYLRHVTGVLVGRAVRRILGT